MDVRPERNEQEQPESAQYPWNSEWGTIPPPPPEHASPGAPSTPAQSAQSGGPPARHLASYVPYIAEQRAAEQQQQAREAGNLAQTQAQTPADARGAAVGRKDAAGCASGAAILAVLSKLAVAGKVLLPFLSAVASLVTYAWLFGWQFGLGILVLLFAHEMGHYVIIRAKGLPASWPVFIPLLGAYVAMRRMPVNVRDEAEIAIAGPFAGAMASALCFWLYQVTGFTVLLPLAYFSFLINLLNLIPVSPLDGGRIVGAISRWIWPIGLVALAIAFLYTQSILLIILLWLGFLETISRFRMAAVAGSYYRIPLLSRAYITIFYFGLAAALA
ncbi:MAG TPA: site-2 protease family protein, partial [Ktedonobacterales bacterium]|nr:site-2 protease family protein [Ktedonobacterales bacterium]